MNTNPEQTPISSISTPAPALHRKPSPNYAAVGSSFYQFLAENIRVAATLLLLPLLFVTYPIFSGLLWQWTPSTDLSTLLSLCEARFGYLCTSGLGPTWLFAAIALLAARAISLLLVRR